VLERSGSRLIVAGAGLVEAAREAAGEGVEVLDLDALLAGLDDDAAPFMPAAAAGPRSLAYVIYTSGSTGAPKGAMVEHRGMLNHLLAKARGLSLTEADAVAQTAPLCFDISVWQMLSPLAAGGRVEVLPDSEAHDPAALLKAVEGRGVTVLELVPSMLRAVNERLEAEGAGAPGRLRWLLATGEALPPAVCRAWLRATGGRVPVVNAYGPTECSDDVTHEFVRREEEAEGAQVPVGRPLQNTRLYVVNSTLEPAPVGVAGELLVGGDGVGRGYLGEAKLTAERFIPDPFSGEAGGRLYRTGDLVKYLADGRVEFLGRLDEQVKVRGHRIELGEIESALLRHESVREAVVVVREDAPGDRRLVAYLSGAGEAPPVVSELRSFLKETLPEYMVPAAFVVLDSLPLTANGKVDKKALPAPDASGAELTEGYVAPRNATEETLAGIWSQVLGVERVGAEDNFFELGGHSLLATQLMSRVLLEFGVQVGLRSFFEEPTVAGLALAVVQEQAAQTDEAEMAAILAELDGLAEDAEGAQLFDNVGTAAD
jgi:amino acid adenylation domain-containing protein